MAQCNCAHAQCPALLLHLLPINEPCHETKTSNILHAISACPDKCKHAHPHSLISILPILHQDGICIVSTRSFSFLFASHNTYSIPFLDDEVFLLSAFKFRNIFTFNASEEGLYTEDKI